MSSILGLDIGEKRVGVAIADAPVFLAHPLATIETAELQEVLETLFRERDIEKIVVGYPRNQSGEATAQTGFAQAVMQKLQIPKGVHTVWQDESLTSVKAEAELAQRGRPYQKADIDALAATYILEDYLKENG